MNTKDMQNLNRRTILYIKDIIKPGMKLAAIKSLCEEYLLSNGADSFWYYDVGAFIFSGLDTIESISGRNYVIKDKVIEENDIITIDLSPQCKNVWGDYARTIILEKGSVIHNVSEISNECWKNGLLMEDKLHKALYDVVTQYTTFEDLYYYMNNLIVENGYKNRDFLGNLGHSIERCRDNRIYIEKGNKKKLSSAGCFTFEPHITDKEGKYGFKKENIYSIKDGKLIEV